MSELAKCKALRSNSESNAAVCNYDTPPFSFDITMKQLLTLICALGFTTAFAQQETVDLSIAQKIKLEEMRNSQVEQLSYQLLDYAGPRLAGSDGMERGEKIAKEAMAAYGLSNPRIDFACDWPRGGWDIDKAYMAMTAPYYIPIFPGPVAWTDGTGGAVRGEVVLVSPKDKSELEAFKGSLKGKIVLMPSVVDYQISFDPLARRLTEKDLENTAYYPITKMQPRRPRPVQMVPGTELSYQEVLEFVRKEQPAVIIHENGNYSVPGLGFYKKELTGATPCEVNIACENHGLMERLIRHGEKVEMDIDIAVHFSGNRTINNVMAEIPGTDPRLKDELVLLGGHLDCYQMSPGAGDDGAGFIAMLEAVRILKEIGVQPRRTIRVIFWGGEEQGLYGSTGYVKRYVQDGEKKLKEHAKISAYFNSDYGPGKFRGIYTQDNLQVYPLFEAWMQPFKDTGFTTLSNRSVGSTDLVPFDEAGIPAFQFIQDPMEWGRHSHRTQDFSDRLVLDDIRHNAVIIAWFAYNAAMRSEMLPRK